MEITYNTKKLTYNVFLSPKETITPPEYKISDLGYKYYTLIMYDPDAPSGNYWHWVVHIDKTKTIDTTILPYVGATPPDKTQHHYRFELYGKNEPFPQTPFEQRNLPLAEGKSLLGLDNPLLIEVFSSETQKTNGGTRKRRNKKNPHNRKTHRQIRNKNKRTRNKK